MSSPDAVSPAQLFLADVASCEPLSPAHCRRFLADITQRVFKAYEKALETVGPEAARLRAADTFDEIGEEGWTQWLDAQQNHGWFGRDSATTIDEKRSDATVLARIFDGGRMARLHSLAGPAHREVIEQAMANAADESDQRLFADTRTYIDDVESGHTNRLVHDLVYKDASRRSAALVAMWPRQRHKVKDVVLDPDNFEKLLSTMGQERIRWMMRALGGRGPFDWRPETSQPAGQAVAQTGDAASSKPKAKSSGNVDWEMTFQIASDAYALKTEEGRAASLITVGDGVVRKPSLDPAPEAGYNLATGYNLKTHQEFVRDDLHNAGVTRDEDIDKVLAGKLELNAAQVRALLFNTIKPYTKMVQNMAENRKHGLWGRLSPAQHEVLTDAAWTSGSELRRSKAWDLLTKARDPAKVDPATLAQALPKRYKDGDGVWQVDTRRVTLRTQMLSGQWPHVLKESGEAAARAAAKRQAATLQASAESR